MPLNNNLKMKVFKQSRRDSCLDALDAARPSSTIGGGHLAPDIYITTDADCGDPVGGNVSACCENKGNRTFCNEQCFLAAQNKYSKSKITAIGSWKSEKRKWSLCKGHENWEWKQQLLYVSTEMGSRHIEGYTMDPNESVSDIRFG